ncbi:hypothetical protein ACFQZ4_23960 [Catellatospora coxensis]
MSEQTTTTPDQGTVVVLRQDKFAEYCDARGWRSSRLGRAEQIGVVHTTLRRLEHGGNPGPKLIAQVLAKLGVPFEAVFDRKKVDA